MKLTALRLHNVKRFGGRGIAIENIGKGVNVLCEVNEFGKSTCFDALHALFFSPYSGIPQAVQSLRPYSGGNPLVEADIETEAGRFRLRKQYYGGRRAQVSDLATGRLVAQADEAEHFIGELVRGGQAGPAGLLWVRQGNTGLERRTKAEDDGEKRARETVLTSVQGEVESVTGGRRMRAVAEACEQERAQLVTAQGRPKAGGPYAAALDTRDRLAAQAEALQSEVDALHEALDQRRRVRSRLSELNNPEDHAARQEAVTRAEARAVKARLHAEKLGTARAEAALKRSLKEASSAALTTYAQAVERHAKLTVAAAEQDARRRNARDHLVTSQNVLESAVQAMEEAEAEEAQARALLERLDRALRAKEASEKLAALHQTLTEADALRQSIEAGEAAVRVLSLPAETIDELEAAEAEIARLKAAESIRATHLRMDYVTDDVPRVDGDGLLLAPGQEVPLTGQTRLTLPGLGVLTVRPGIADGEAGTLADLMAAALSARNSCLDRLGVDSLAAARHRQRQAREQSDDVTLLTQRLAVLAPQGLEVLRERIATLEAEGKESFAPETPISDALAQAETEAVVSLDQVREALGAAARKVAEARRSVSELRPRQDLAHQAVIAAETEGAALTAEMEALNTQLGEASERDETVRRLSTQAEIDQGDWQIADARVQALESEALDLEAVEASLSRTRSVIDGVEAEKAGLAQTLAELTGRIGAQSEHAVEENLQETLEKLREADAQVARYTHQVAVLDRLRGALNAARTNAREQYFEPVLGELRPLLGLLFDDANVVFDDETLMPSVLRRNGLEEPIPVLSGGMREQLTILTRLAFARLLAKQGRPAPLILDDALVYSDDDRIEKMFDALHRQARDQQIIVFSCRQRAFSQLGGNRLILRDWRPDD
ncbi:hypothetical protein [Asticcacaulis sp.]|uniref:AAA family ATPase n=1 Tax=Asticcacaulis sp. TaxID=1872648 RepID=UPI0026349418|nr:hypothetical protein [Asticcacaulis sp.]